MPATVESEEEPEPEPVDPRTENKVRGAIIKALRQVGRNQTGAAVDLAWICDAAKKIAVVALGCSDFELDAETNMKALRRVEHVALAELLASASASAGRSHSAKTATTEAGDRGDVPF